MCTLLQTQVLLLHLLLLPQILLHCRWEECASPSSAHRNKEGVTINSGFDSGNIEVRVESKMVCCGCLTAPCSTQSEIYTVWGGG
jgi:hypothetical protein